MNASNAASTRFEGLVEDLLEQFPVSPLVARTMEAGLSKILELIEGSPGERPEFARCFIEMLQGARPSPEWLISYCMRTLQWPEIQRAAEDVIAAGDPRLFSQASEVAGTYESDDEWPGAHLFDRYAESDGEERPGRS